MSTKPKATLDTLRLPFRERLRLVAAMRPSNRVPDGTRRLARVDYNLGHAIVELGPAASALSYSIAPRNLSALGMSFVHGRFVHAGMACRCLLPTRVGTVVTVPGKTTRCRHVQGVLHEVSVTFDAPIELPRFIGAQAAERRQGPRQRA